MSHHPGKFTWFEHVSDDPAKARAFYEGLFGWEVRAMTVGDAPYDMIHNGSQGIGGFYRAPAGVPNHWISYVSVPEVDVAYKAALAAGAKSIMAPTAFAGIGRGATIADPAGAVFALWTGAEGDRDDVDPVPAGDWVWNELATPDPKQALSFYEGVLGFTHDEMNMGPQGTYYIVKGPDGVARGGVMKSPHAGMPAMWTPYVHVEDADKTAARVAPLGGRLVMPPESIPGVGRIAALVDPQGAAIAIIRPDPRA